MSLTKRLITLRKNIRENQSKIIDKLRDNHTYNLYLFCATEDNLTKEHILPQWVYAKDSKKFFVTNINGISQTYNKSVLPCCPKCNNEVLGHLEYVIQGKFKNIDLDSNHFENKELELIILWLEIIEYKLQAM